jgi:hypothetical protein
MARLHRLKVPANTVGKTKVLLTVVGGKIVWREGI